MSLLWLASSYFTLFSRWPYRESLKIKELLHVNQLHDITFRSHLVDVCTFQRKLRLVTFEFKLKWMQNMHEGSFHVRWSSEMGFFIWPSPKCTKFYKGKDLRLLSSTKLGFLKSDLYFQNYEHMKFWCFSGGLDQKILVVLLLELQLIVTPSSLNIFIQYFAIKWKAPCWTKQHTKFFTGDIWTLVYRCYKATCFSCALKQWFSTGVSRKTSVLWKIVRCSPGNLVSLTSVPSNTGRKSLV